MPDRAVQRGLSFDSAPHSQPTAPVASKAVENVTPLTNTVTASVKSVISAPVSTKTAAPVSSVKASVAPTVPSSASDSQSATMSVDQLVASANIEVREKKRKSGKKKSNHSNPGTCCSGHTR